jgi:hypothetical protein
MELADHPVNFGHIREGNKTGKTAPWSADPAHCQETGYSQNVQVEMM